MERAGKPRHRWETFQPSKRERTSQSEALDTLKSGEDMVGLEKAFAAAEQEDYRPGESKEPKRKKNDSLAPARVTSRRSSIIECLACELADAFARRK
jgi:hypothetical protein